MNFCYSSDMFWPSKSLNLICTIIFDLLINSTRPSKYHSSKIIDCPASLKVELLIIAHMRQILEQTSVFSQRFKLEDQIESSLESEENFPVCQRHGKSKFNFTWQEGTIFQKESIATTINRLQLFCSFIK